METELQVGGNDEEVWFEISDDYHNGMYYRFITDDEHAGRSSNIEDVICIMAISQISH